MGKKHIALGFQNNHQYQSANPNRYLIGYYRFLCDLLY